VSQTTSAVDAERPAGPDVLSFGQFYAEQYDGAVRLARCAAYAFSTSASGAGTAGTYSPSPPTTP
jgi:hypothetical protein